MNYNQALITAGAGLIGSHIADQLVRRVLKKSSCWTTSPAVESRI
jgi:nucleoside-diphosphate-sugar epimerase